LQEILINFRIEKYFFIKIPAFQNNQKIFLQKIVKGILKNNRKRKYIFLYIQQLTS